MAYETQQTVTVAGVTLSRDMWRRIGLGGFLIAGVLFVIASAISIWIGWRQTLTYLDIHMTIAFVALIPAIAGLYAVQKHALSRFGHVSLLFFLGATILGVVGQVTYFAAPQFDILAPVTLGLMMLGALLAGIATYRSGVLPRWAGVLLAIAFPSPFLVAAVPILLFNVPPPPEHGNESGVILPGLAWLGLTYALWKYGGEPVTKKSSGDQ